MEQRQVTYNEVCHNGACYSGVIEFYKEHFDGRTAVTIQEVLDVGRYDVAQYLKLDGSGDGYGYGYGYGSGSGSGYGDD